MKKKQDLVVIGGGPGGLVVASVAAQVGLKVTLIEKSGQLGGDCLHTGCVPSKALIHMARTAHVTREGVRQGLLSKMPEIDFGKAIDHVNSVVEKILVHDDPERFRSYGCDVRFGKAQFINKHEATVDGETIAGRRFVIATGSKPIVPDAWKAFGDRVITTDDVFEQEDLPKSLAVIGMGTIGLELGQSMRRLGIEVTGFDQLDTLGGSQDPKICACAKDILGKEFPIHLGHRAEINEAEGGKLRVTAGNTSVVVDKVLAAMGRVPNLGNLGLENLDLELDQRGIPVFDRNTMQIGNLPVFLAGDVNGERQVLHEAGDEGRIAGYNAVNDQVQAFKRKIPLSINFCDPNICIVGERFKDLDPATTAVGEVKLAPVGRALIMGKNRGIIRIYADKASGRLLGSEMITTKGENLAHLLAWSIQQELTVGDLLRMPFYHPVIEEAMQAALYDLYSKVDKKNHGGIMELAPV